MTFWHYCKIEQLDDETFYIKSGIEEVELYNDEDDEFINDTLGTPPYFLAVTEYLSSPRQAVLIDLRCELIKKIVEVCVDKKAKYIDSPNQSTLEHYEFARKILKSALDQTV